MARFLFVVAALIGLRASAAVAQTQHDYTFVHHQVSTGSQAAQDSFDRGLTFAFAFNRQAAEKAFREAAALDPHLAIAWWGVALALGPNINISMSKSDMASALDAVTKAKALEAYASAEERRLIDAVAVRYAPNGNEKKLAILYAAAMKAVASTFPDDPNIEALYLESEADALFLNSANARWAEWLETDSRAIADVNRWPTHIGILHYFIHLTEPNTSPLAVHVADTLAADTFAPQASHLTHMPSHVYVYIGAWQRVDTLNHEAVEMDESQAKAAGIDPSKLDYFFHNLSFWYGAAVMSGDSEGASAAADLWKRYDPDALWIAETRLGRFDVAERDLDASGISRRLRDAKVATLVAYGIACAQTQRLVEANRASAELHRHKNLGDLGIIAQNIVDGRIAEARGDDARAQDLYAHAARLQDASDFEVVPPWSYYPRELLAALDFRIGDAIDAAKVAQTDLLQHPMGVPSLRLLQKAYVALGRTADADNITRELQVQTSHP